MKEFGYIVDRYAYRNLSQYEEAKKEVEAIEYIKANTDITNVKNAYGLYKKFNEQPSFKTEIGLEFMKQLYDVCVASGIISYENMEPIKVEQSSSVLKEKVMTSSEVKSGKEETSRIQLAIRNRNLKIVVAFLAATIAIMFYIAKTSDYSHITDYETRIINQYSQWEDELTQREQELREKEKELKNKSE